MTLIGRGGPWARLAARFDGARVGRGGLVFVLGEPGVGKSRLTRELAGRAAAAGVAVLVGRAVESAVPVPYRALAEVVLAATRDPAVLDLPDLAPVRPVLAAFLPGAGPAAPECSPLLVGEAVLRLCGRLGPVVLVLEDLQWADSDTLAAVELLADQLDGEPVLCVATVRAPAAGGAPGFVRRLARRRSVDLVELARLSADEVAELASACLGGSAVPPPVLDRLLAGADGLPLLVEELLAGLSGSGHLTRTDAGWRAAEDLPQVVPVTLGETVRDRLARDGAPTRQVLGAAAVLGHRFDWRLLAPSTGRPLTEIIDILRAAVDAHLVQAVDGGFAFRHALTRDAVLLDLLAPERALLAKGVLRAIDAAATPYPAGLVAGLADTAGDRPRAAAAYLDLGRDARRIGALGTAEAVLSRAVELAGSDDRRLADGGELLVEVLGLAGRSDRVGPVGRWTLDALHAIGARPERVGAVRLAMARATGDPELLDSVERLAEQAGATELRARAHALRAHLDLEAGRLDDARRHAELALRGAEVAGLPEVACEALEMLGRHARAGDPQAAARAFRRAVEIADSHELGLWRVRARTELGIVAFLRGEPPDALVQARELAVASGAVATAATVDLHLSAAFWQRFEPDRALDAARRYREAVERYRWSGRLPRALMLEAAALAQLGRTEEMVARLGEIARLAPGDRELEAVGWGMAHAVVHLVADQLDALRSALDRAVTLLRDAGSAPSYRFWGLWALLVSIDGPGGEQACAQARAAGAEVFGLASAYLRYAEAVRAGRAGEHALAEEHFAAGEALTGDLAFFRHHAHRLVAPAAARDGWGEPVRWLRAALARFDELGRTRLADACKAELRAQGAAVPRAGRDRVPAALRALEVTARETEVLDLVAEGRSNHAIAARLHLSVRTVEGHVGALRRKLGAASRAELVVRATRVVAEP
ncbi:MAG: ATP-binding protein [Pseudonocardia sp.]